MKIIRTRKMAAGLQERMLRAAMVRGGRDPEKADVSALMDRTLHYGENRRNIQRQMGISTRDTGREYHVMEKERARQESRRREERKDPLRQTGITNEGMDRRFQAMKPGKRGHPGHWYYERRANRTDRGSRL